jgi:hypothetical protein
MRYSSLKLEVLSLNTLLRVLRCAVFFAMWADPLITVTPYHHHHHHRTWRTSLVCLHPQVSRRFNGESALKRAFDACDSDRCRSALLAGWLAANGVEHPHAWSHVVWKLFSNPTAKCV